MHMRDFWDLATPPNAVRYCFKVCQKHGDTQAETIRKIQQAFCDDAIGVTQIKVWFNRFEDGSMSFRANVNEPKC
jgi:hypothetical protein